MSNEAADDDRPITLNPEAVGDAGQTPTVQLPDDLAAFFERGRCPDCDRINNTHDDDCPSVPAFINQATRPPEVSR
jgi:hypothetical protein